MEPKEIGIYKMTKQWFRIILIKKFIELQKYTDRKFTEIWKIPKEWEYWQENRNGKREPDRNLRDEEYND